MIADLPTGLAPGAALSWADPTADQFEFWQGTWLAESLMSGAELSVAASNEVTWLWGGAALLENFSMPGAERPFHGRSLSVPVVGRGWCQTWVDSEGQYLDFVGGRVGDEMILDRTATRPDGSIVRQRMRWWDICPHAFCWDWLQAFDGAAEWELLWQLRYHREEPRSRPDSDRSAE